MELRHLRYFVAVADTCHFGRAAQRLHVAQPALSQAIRQLEDELGVTLFSRTTRSVTLTPAGEFFRAEAQRMIGGLERGVEGVRRIADGRTGLVRIGFTGTAAFDQLPAIARAAGTRLPTLSLEIHGDLLTPAQVEALRSGDLDVAVLRPPVAGDDIETRILKTESLVLALPADHRLAGEPALSVADLAHDDFVLYSDAHSAVNDAVVRSCRAAGFAPRRAHEAPGTAVLLALVAAGLGVAIVPESVRRLTLDGVVLRDLDGAETIDLAVAWSRDRRSAQVESLLAVLRDAGIVPVSPSDPSPADLPDEWIVGSADTLEDIR
ncbi:LysR substrate-binding domain-containing protein [Williamsia serinedens]|uniref:Transcriptional regulator, LysR family n=1 Tax=Williamsia serinedens TaxID=391736 RepID=A0ABT1H049_9NOCA|nr:LysR substrate-binding domain-containing protein [Williamsia serinedens]MCP2160619.1 transcriptional regulator, LysR family [Williamsia serinedens]